MFLAGWAVAFGVGEHPSPMCWQMPGMPRATAPATPSLQLGSVMVTLVAARPRTVSKPIGPVSGAVVRPYVVI
jgi:hypothetical protein